MITYTPLSTATVRALQAGGPDANGQTPERVTSDGIGTPCRHCLQDVPAGAAMLVLAHRPFPAPQPYAEMGPIFLCADAAVCDAPAPGSALPAILSSDTYILRGYGADHRIVYGTGAVVRTDDLTRAAETRLADARVAYLHLRSARNNCYQLRIDRG